MNTLASSALLLATGSVLGWAATQPQEWDQASNTADSETESVVRDDSEDSGEAAGLDSLTFVRGTEIPVASARVLEDGEEVETVMVDAYLDWDFGALTFYGEDGSIAAIPAPKNWEFRHVQLPDGGGMVALCFQPGTGLTFLLDGEGQWAPIAEPSTDLVVGDYDVTLTVDVDRLFALRFDQFSGRSWTLEDDGWAPIVGNLRGWPLEEGAEEAGTQGNR